MFPEIEFERMKRLPNYVFAEVNAIKMEAISGTTPKIRDGSILTTINLFLVIGDVYVVPSPCVV
jgi:hypothetical protein